MHLIGEISAAFIVGEFWSFDLARQFRFLASASVIACRRLSAAPL